MKAGYLPLSEVKKLPHYGEHFPFIPWSFASKLRVSWVFTVRLLEEIGLLRFAAFWLEMPFRMLPVHRELRDGFRMTRRRFGVMAEMEWTLLVLIYRDIEKRSGKQRAYAFAKDAIQRSSLFMMNDFYQADRLAEFADPFEAFWSYHQAMFRDDPNYPNELRDEGDRKVMVVHQCMNCEISRLTIPELATLGCDHDITGYKAIEEKTQMEFRRPVTLAKDGKPCEFMFYRKGKVPAGEVEVH